MDLLRNSVSAAMCPFFAWVRCRVKSVLDVGQAYACGTFYSPSSQTENEQNFATKAISQQALYLEKTFTMIRSCVYDPKTALRDAKHLKKMAQRIDQSKYADHNPKAGEVDYFDDEEGYSNGLSRRLTYSQDHQKATYMETHYHPDGETIKSQEKIELTKTQDGQVLCTLSQDQDGDGDFQGFFDCQSTLELTDFTFNFHP